MIDVTDAERRGVYLWIVHAIRSFGPPPYELAVEVRRICELLERAAKEPYQTPPNDNSKGETK